MRKTTVCFKQRLALVVRKCISLSSHSPKKYYETDFIQRILVENKNIHNEICVSVNAGFFI